MPAARVTPHQGQVLDRIWTRAKVRGSVATAETIGCYNACHHLAAKGLVLVVQLPSGPRGGRREGYALTDTGFALGLRRKYTR